MERKLLRLIMIAGVALGLVVASLPSFAAEILSAPRTAELVQSNSIVLVDIRRPSEWKSSGVAESAHLISMHQPGFLQKIKELMAGRESKKLAFICATGGRTAWLSAELEKRGFTNLYDVSEGMFGSRAGPGWLARKLPVRAYP